MHIRIRELTAIEMKVGPHRIDVDPYFDGPLPIGRHRIRWRLKGASSWKTSETVEFVEGEEYLLHLGPTRLDQRTL